MMEYQHFGVMIDKEEMVGQVVRKFDLNSPNRVNSPRIERFW